MLFQQQGLPVLPKRLGSRLCPMREGSWAALFPADGRLRRPAHLSQTVPHSPCSQHQWLSWKLGPQHSCHGWEEGAWQSLKEYSMTCTGSRGAGWGTVSLAAVLQFKLGVIKMGL